ncbi:LacI family DNA-binding transcriptional regulator [Streptomyces cacaoi]|uniref:LacI family DNA-binding transcriptional regulator n=1 Tax=Streptomyces cacaoi TaxID=1898 RepID=UPI003332DBFB
MAFGHKTGNYYRGRYKAASGKYESVRDSAGNVVRFRTKTEAKQAAEAEEVKVRQGLWRDPAAGRITFGEYVSRWYAEQELAASTMQNYKRHLEQHLLPDFEEKPLAEISRQDVAAWEKREKAEYAASSVKTWHSTLHLVLEDAIAEGLIETNPATKRRGRGKRAGRSRDRGPEKVVTDALGILLVAERMAILSGRDDEFVACVQKGYTGMRWGELVGLETEFVRPAGFRVEWQLYELDSGELVRCPPKDDSYRTVDGPEFLTRLVRDHVASKKLAPCPCHGKRYVYSAVGAVKGGQPGAKLVDVARAAGVSTGTVSNVLNRPEHVAAATRQRVEEAVADLGFVRGVREPGEAAHWRRNGFSVWQFTPAVSGWYPKKAPQEARPVPVRAEPWPGVPVRGRNSQGRATACWVPIQTGLTPHGLRHTHKTLMEELGTPKVLMDERMGHIDGSVSARYSHVTAVMRERLCRDLTDLWHRSLDARARMSPGSPVAVLDRLLKERLEAGVLELTA